jgi:predicted transposase YbfD/YdcC
LPSLFSPLILKKKNIYNNNLHCNIKKREGKNFLEMPSLFSPLILKKKNINGEKREGKKGKCIF